MKESDLPKRKIVYIGKQIVKDGKPLDFSFKSVRKLVDIVSIIPRSGDRLPIPKQESPEEKKQSQQPQQSSRLEVKSGESEELQEEVTKKTKQIEPFKQPQPPQINRILAQHTTSKIVTSSIPGQTDDNPNTVIKKRLVRSVTTSLILSYNTIPDLLDFQGIMSRVMANFMDLKWVDLSNNHLVNISSELCVLKQLMSLYLHGNYIPDMAEVQNLRESPVKFLTLHGNPIDQISGYRMWVICLLPQIKRLDSVLITKLELDNAVGFRRYASRQRNLPYIENPQVPVPPKDPDVEEEEEEQKENS